MGVLAFFSAIGERVFAGKWIAGPHIDDAMRRAREVNALGMSAIINYIGEDLRSERDLADAVDTYLRLITAIRKKGVKADVSLKITQLGLRISKKLASENYARIVAHARKNGIFVWLDAESNDTVEDAISIYEKQARRGGVGIAVQTYLRRSEKIAERLLAKRAVIRLVKGAYKQSAAIAFKDRSEVTRNYLAIMRLLFRHAREFTVATHDPEILHEALRLNRASRKKVTYAMLNGIRNRYAARLAAEGNSVAIYIPFGTRWVEYSLRRVREESHLILLLRSLLGG